MKLILSFLITSLFTLNVYGQVDPKIWDSLKTVRSENYELKIPYKWKELPSYDSEGQEYYFDADGLALPSIFNREAITVSVLMYDQVATNLEDAKDKRIGITKSKKYREFPKQFKEGEEKIKLASGQDAYILNTKFYRTSKRINESRFYLVVYSDKARTAYVYILSVQYQDNTYQFETDNDLAGFAKKLFGYFKLL